MKKFIITTLVLSLIVLGIGSVSVGAQGGPGHGYRYDVNQRPNYEQNEVNYLDLEEEQLERIEDYKDEFFDKREEVVEKLQDKRYELREAILSEKAAEVISELQSEVSQLQKELTEERTDYLKKMRSVLNDEQAKLMIENEYRIGLRSGSGFRFDRTTFNRRPDFGSNFNHFQVRSSRSFQKMGGGFRSPGRGYCY